MRKKRAQLCGGFTEFFYLSMSYNNLANYYQTNFSLMQHHKYSLTELENMIPYEREIYTTMLIRFLEEEEERQKQKG